MNRHASIRLAVSLLCAGVGAFGLPAQNRPQVLVLTGTSPLLAQLDPGFCNVSICPPAFAPSPNLWSGGTAHDPRDRHTWISNGLLLMKVDPRLGCSTLCAPFAVPGVPAGQHVTGLAFNEFTQQLFVSHTPNVIQTFLAVGCTLTFQSSCTVTLPTNHYLSGLATDDVNNHLYYASSPWAGPGSPSEIAAAFQNAPCTPICPAFQLPTSSAGTPFGNITGLAWDPCAGGTLFVSNDNEVEMLHILHPGCIQIAAGYCGTIVPGDRAIGLCVLPATEVFALNNCFAGSVGPCTTMQHVLGGDPAIGNLAFSLDLVGAPPGVISVVTADIGACNPTGNLGLCDLVPSSPPLCFPTFTAGGPCAATASCAFPLPPLTFLCNITISTRWWGWVGGIANHYVSNCVEWTITGT